MWQLPRVPWSHCRSHKGIQRDGKGGEHCGLPNLWHWPCPGCLQGFATCPREKAAVCAGAAAFGDSFFPLQSLCFGGVAVFPLSREAACKCRFRLHRRHPQPSWSSTFYQCAGPWCFSRTFVCTTARLAVTWVLISPKPVALESTTCKHLSCTVPVQLPRMVLTFLPVN